MILLEASFNHPTDKKKKRDQILLLLLRIDELVRQTLGQLHQGGALP